MVILLAIVASSWLAGLGMELGSGGFTRGVNPFVQENKVVLVTVNGFSEKQNKFT